MPKVRGRKCPYCKETRSEPLNNRGIMRTTSGKRVKTYHCYNCGKLFGAYVK